jgi:hypothetical protein
MESFLGLSKDTKFVGTVPGNDPLKIVLNNAREKMIFLKKDGRIA